MVYCVTFELKNKNKDYSKFFEGLKSSGYWWHQSENVWFISTTSDANYIRTFLNTFLSENDKIFVIKCANSWAGLGYSKEEYDWLKSNL